MSRLNFSLLLGFLCALFGTIPVLPCSAESPRGFNGISLGDSLEQVRSKLGDLMEAGCQGASECCSCGAYFTIIKPGSGLQWDFGEFAVFDKRKTVGEVGEICLGNKTEADVETYIPKYIPDGRDGRVDRCLRSGYLRHGKVEVIGMVFSQNKLCYVAFIIPKELEPQLTGMMRDNKTSNAKKLESCNSQRCSDLPVGKGYKLNGIVWLIMDQTIGVGVYTAGNCLVIYDEDKMAKITEEADNKMQEKWKKINKIRYFGK